MSYESTVFGIILGLGLYAFTSLIDSKLTIKILSDELLDELKKKHEKEDKK